MRRRNAVVWLAAAPALASAQPRFPDRPISLLVPFSPGGVADITARAVAEPMGRLLGQAVVVENKPSAGSIVASQAVATARPDGHTLLLMSNGNAVSVSLFRKLPFDVTRDFAPIGTLAAFDLAIFASAASHFASLRAAVASARSFPGKLTIGTIAVGSTQHLVAKLFEATAGIEALIVPYKASPPLVTALRSGEIDLAVEIVGPLLPQVSAGAIKALAVTGDTRHPSLPEVPTVREQGIAGFNVRSWNALAAPAGTPAPVIDRLQTALHDALASADVQTQFKRLGVRAMPGTPAELRRLLASEIQRWGEVIRAAKIEPE